ncbi:MAG: hypothetical protein AAGM67_02055, partial [Bacteroidota bacterium]
GSMELLFRDRFYPFIHSSRMPLLILYAAIVCVYLAFAVQLEPDPETPKLFPDDDNYVKFDTLKADTFAREENTRRYEDEIYKTF